MAIKLVILTGLMVAGLVGAHAQPLSGQTQPSIYGILASVGVMFFAYAGYGMTANAAGSVSHPAQTVPRAIYLAIAVVAVLYVGLAVVVLQSISPANLAAHADTAVAEAARPVFGHFGYVIVSIAALLATASAINATLFSAIRIAAALADTGRLPGHSNPGSGATAASGVLLSVARILLATNFLHPSAIASIASATFLIASIAVQVAHWRLSQETGGSRTLIMLGALAMAAVLLATTQPWSIGMIAAFVAGTALLEIVQERRNAPDPPEPKPLSAAHFRRSSSL